MGWPAMFASLFLAELPDKTSLAALVLMTRYRAWTVWCGASAALAAQTILALTMGRILALVPQKPLTFVEAALFMGFSVWLVKESLEPAENALAEPLVEQPSKTDWKSLGRIFVVIFAAEFFDLTQVATATFVANRPHQMVAVGLVAVTALVAADAVIVGFGRILLSQVPARYIQRAAAVLFFLMGVGLLVSVIHVTGL